MIAVSTSADGQGAGPGHDRGAELLEVGADAVEHRQALDRAGR